MSTAYPGPQGGQNNFESTPEHNPAYATPSQGEPYAPHGAPMNQSFAPQPPVKGRNIIGIIGLVCAVLGVIFSCIPGFLILGWILLPIAFILGLVGLFPKGKKKGTAIAALIISIVGTIVAALVFAVVVDSAFDDAFNQETTVSNNEASNAVGGGTTDASVDGATRENPLPIGATISSDEWDVTINSVDLNATDAILAENQFNDAPAEGQVYVMANVTAKYKGNDPEGAIPFVDIDYISPQGNSFSTHDIMVVEPDAFDHTTTLYEGAEETGNIAFLVDAATAADGVLSVEPDMFTQKRFVAVK